MQSQITLLKNQWTLHEKKQGTLVYPSQKQIAEKIYTELTTNNRICVTLCAPPQWGKTGISLHLANRFTTTQNEWFTDINNVFFCTGMSDRTMVNQTKNRVLPCWKNNVYHRNTFHKVIKQISALKNKQKDKNIVIILDECHIANLVNQEISTKLHNLGLFDIDYLLSHNIKILQISATPSNSLVDCLNWDTYHTQITVPLFDGYVSFEQIKQQNRIRECVDLTDINVCRRFCNGFSEFSNPKYHIIRLSIVKDLFGNSPYLLGKTNLKTICKESNYKLIELNGTLSRKEKQQIFLNLESQPEVHTIILIKNMLRAGKTLCDKYIGYCQESITKIKNYSSEVQGLPGRLCGWGKQKGKEAPIIYCTTEIIDNYILLYKNNFNYNLETLEWKDSRLIKKVNKTNVNSKPSIFYSENTKGLTKMDKIKKMLLENNGKFVHSSDEEDEE
jgi:hypothetical protein